MRASRSGHSSGPDAPTVVLADDREHATGPTVDPTRWTQLAAEVLDALGVRAPCELTLHLVDAARISDLNAEHLGGTGPTDVLSFPIDQDWPDRSAPDRGTTTRILGDVVICPDVVAAQAPEHAGTFEDELALMIVHGILHLVGHDHADPDEARIMRDLEAEVLRLVHRPVGVGTVVPEESGQR